MTTDLILGSAWGDEGKGKLIDILSGEADICARAQGGANAGHAVYVNNISYSFHLLPSGLLRPQCQCLLGSGTVVHVPTFFKELEALEARGIERPRERLLISDRCHIITDCHIAVDGLEELELGEKSIGTTKRGIGPTYSTMASRSGIIMAEMLHEPLFERKLRALAAGFKKRYGDLLSYDVEDEITRFKAYRQKLLPFLTDAVVLVSDAQKSGKRILVEGAQALLLDLNYGTYPYCTSSNTGLGGVMVGLGLNPRKLNRIVGVVKAYVTRVGSGCLKTEQLNSVGEDLQTRGGEIGTTTGRKRRCGWLDLVVIRYSHQLNHYDCLNLTKLDVLDSFASIKVAVAYKDPETGRELPSFPADLELLERCEVRYVEKEGWNSSTAHMKSWDALPKQAKAYVNFIEEFVGCRVRWIGTGKNREDMIDRGD